MSDYILTRVPRRWVPAWLWRMACLWTPLAGLLAIHDPDRCECPCHGTTGIRVCAFCGEGQE